MGSGHIIITNVTYGSIGGYAYVRIMCDAFIC